MRRPIFSQSFHHARMARASTLIIMKMKTLKNIKEYKFINANTNSNGNDNDNDENN